MKIKGYFIALVICISLNAFGQNLKGQIDKLRLAITYINLFYVDSVNGDKLVNDAIKKILEELDPHSDFYTKEEAKEMDEPLVGGFEGIGIQFNVLYDTIFVVNTIPGGPSEKLGILAGDRIIKVDGENVAGIGITSNDVRKKLMGQKGTIVKVTILRKGEKKLLDFTITRDIIPIYSVDASYMINDSIGYIKLNQFSKTTMDEFRDSVLKFQSNGNFKNLILDLRNNTGGYLNVAVSLADEFLSQDEIVVFTKGLNSARRNYVATDQGLLEKGRLIVLIDEGSASASEILSGSIQDWDRGVIVGRRSFGKGLVQSQYEFPDGSRLKLTTARYYTPTGRLIQKPYNNGTKEYDHELIDRYNHGELVNADSIHFPDSLKYLTLVNKRIVYGGGGIMPDFFVPLDTTSASDYYKALFRQGILNRFVLKYIEQNRLELKNKYPQFSIFNENFIISDEILKQFTDFALLKENLKFDEAGFNKDKEDIRLYLKAYIARDLWQNNEFYKIVNPKDDTYKKALDIIQSPSEYNKLIGNQKDIPIRVNQ